MPRLVFTIPIMPGKSQECVRLLKKYKPELDKAHKAVGCTQWAKYVRGDEYLEIIDWKGRPFVAMLKEYLAYPALKKFLDEITPCVLLPPTPPGCDPTETLAEFLQGRAFTQAYHLVEPPA